MHDTTQAIQRAQDVATQARTDAEAALVWIRSQCPTITTPEQAQWAADAINSVGKNQRDQEAVRKEITAPILEAKRRIDALFKPAAAAQSAILDYLKGILKDYRQREHERQAAALAAASTPEETRAAVQVTPAAPVGISERATWRGEVVDESQLPRDFWIIDQAKLDRTIKAARGQITIPGVRVITDMILVRQG